MIREELRRLGNWEERHRLLVARLTIVFAATLVIDLICAGLTCIFEVNVKGGDIHGFGDALFFSTVQLLTVSSQIRNPLTVGGRIVDVFLEFWAIVVVAGSAGSFASFFTASDRRSEFLA
jgi:hypothetical protein